MSFFPTTIKVGAVGFGRHFRRSLLPNIIGIERFALTDVAELDSGLRDEARTRLPGVRIHKSAAALYAAGTVDAVIVSTNPTAHAKLVRSALENAIHVFVEKPVGFNADIVEELADLADRQGRVGMVGTMWRYAPPMHVLRYYLATHNTEIQAASIAASFPGVTHRADWGLSLRESTFYDMYVHALDWVTALLGPAQAVSCWAAAPGIEWPDRTHIAVWTQQGTASLTLANEMKSYEITAWLCLTDGSLAQIDTNERIRITSDASWSGTEGGIRDWPSHSWEPGQLYRGWGRKGYAEELNEFASCVADGRIPAAALRAHAHTLRVVAAALRARDSNGKEMVS